MNFTQQIKYITVKIVMWKNIKKKFFNEILGHPWVFKKNLFT